MHALADTNVKSYIKKKIFVALDLSENGTGLRLVLMQELAMVDPRQSSPEEWCKTSYGMPVEGSIVKIAENAAKFVPEAFDGILKNYGGHGLKPTHSRNTGRSWRPFWIVDHNAQEAPFNTPFTTCHVMPDLYEGVNWKDCCNHFASCDHTNRGDNCWDPKYTPAKFKYCGNPTHQWRPDGKGGNLQHFFWEQGVHDYIDNIVNV